MVAKNVKQEELERDYQMERLKKVCYKKGINLHNDFSIVNGNINYSPKFKIAFVGHYVEGKNVDALINF